MLTCPLRTQKHQKKHQSLNTSCLIFYTKTLLKCVSIKLSAFYLILWMKNYTVFHDKISLFFRLCATLYIRWGRFTYSGNEIIGMIHLNTLSWNVFIASLQSIHWVWFHQEVFALWRVEEETMTTSDFDEVIKEDWPWIASFFLFIIILLVIGNRWCCACCQPPITTMKTESAGTEHEKDRLYPRLSSSSSRRNSRIYHHV